MILFHLDTSVWIVYLTFKRYKEMAHKWKDLTKETLDGLNYEKLARLSTNWACEEDIRDIITSHIGFCISSLKEDKHKNPKKEHLVAVHSFANFEVIVTEYKEEVDWNIVTRRGIMVRYIPFECWFGYVKT
jgi:hypothetical protein